MSFRLLVVDDDELITATISEMLPAGWSADCYNDPKLVPMDQTFHCAFVDMHLSNDLKIHDGSEFIKVLKSNYPKLEVLAISGDLKQKTMELALEAGATRYMSKPLSQNYITSVLKQIESYFLFLATNQRGSTSNKNNWIGQSKNFLDVTKQIAQFKHEPGPILIEGETGTGKEITAQLLRSSNTAPYIVINVAEVSENLFESEFFGHTKGSFTGANDNKMGLIEAANGGDLFIDEIEALPVSAQVKLLRFLQEGEIRRVGSSEVIKVNVRVVIATNKNLEAMVKENQFREDLLWRINGKKITLPPLRERTEDVELLVKYFLKNISPLKTFSSDSIDLLKKHKWPGNIRELKRLCEKIVSHAPLPIVRPEDIESYIILAEPIELNTESELSLQAQLVAIEKTIIERKLQQHKDIDTVCDKLQVSRSSLYKKIKEHDIKWKNA